jgi:hypothetical protein
MPEKFNPDKEEHYARVEPGMTGYKVEFFGAHSVTVNKKAYCTDSRDVMNALDDYFVEVSE